MLVLLSPSKTMDFASQASVADPSEPQHLTRARKLVRAIRKLSPEDIQRLMNVSEKLAVEVHEAFKKWKSQHALPHAKPAALAYQGDVYTGLQADKWTAAQLDFAQQHLRILSGLYGMVRPRDLIQQYRLEMGVPFSCDGCKDLYEFWRPTLTKSVKKALKESGDSTIVNLASAEYFKAIDTKELDAEIITPQFKDKKNGKYMFLSFFGKKARGQMANYIITKQLKRTDTLQSRFDVGGYRYNPSLSSDAKWVFSRNAPPPA